MRIFERVDALLEHIKLVESETIQLSRDSMLRLDAFMEKNGLEPDDDAVEAMQYQDIISQQLTATIDVIASIQQNMGSFKASFENEANTPEASTLERLEEELDEALRTAREKRDRFSGKVLHDDAESIEFF